MAVKTTEEVLSGACGGIAGNGSGRVDDAIGSAGETLGGGGASDA